MFQSDEFLPRIHVCSGFVHDEYFVLSQQSSGQANQLPLSHAEVAPALGHSGLQPHGQVTDGCLQLNLHNSCSVHSHLTLWKEHYAQHFLTFRTRKS